MKLAKIVSGVAVASAAVVLGASAAFADSPGQLAGGPNVYLVKNITKNGSFVSSVNAACGDELQFSGEMHNPDNGGLTNVMVSANLSTGKFTATPAEGSQYGTSGTVNVTVASGGTLTYENGTTELHDSNGNVIKALPDGITTGSINVGNINGSTTEFVDFKAKVNCQTTPPTPTPPTPAATSKSLPNTGPGDIAGLFVGSSALGGFGHYFYNRRKRS